MDKYISRTEFEEKIQEFMYQHELTSKLVNKQALALSNKIQELNGRLDVFMDRKPDPAMIREAWIRQLPKIRAELQLLGIQVAKMMAPAKQGVSK